MSLRVRLGLAAGVAVAIAVIAVAVASYAGTSPELRGQVDQQLRAQVQRIMPAVGGLTGNGNGNGTPGGYGPGAVPPARGYLNRLRHCNQPAFGGSQPATEIVSATGRVTSFDTSKNRIPVTKRILSVAKAGKGDYFTDTTVKGVHLRVLVHGAQGGALVAALPLTNVDRALSHQLLELIIIAALGIVLAALLALLVARAALSPIARFTRQTEAIAASPQRLDTERLEIHGSDELARLAHTFNDTLDALGRSVESQRNLVADASHELRTPIATIRANLQLMRDEELLTPADREALRRDLIEELDELTALVSDVVELARGVKTGGELGDIRLDDVVTAAVERTRRRAPETTVTVALEPTLVRGEGDRIARAVANLLDNAVKYGPADQTIEVALRGGRLTVRDHGPGFEDEDLPFVFDRFHRARAARAKPGSGLGLAIVRQAAEAHGGHVTAANAPGGGALMTIDFGPAVEMAAQAPADPVASGG